MESLIEKANLPGEFGMILLLFGLVLLLAPWLSGTDFGFLKIPSFPESTRRTLRILGPIMFVTAIIIHLPILTKSVYTEDIQNPPSQDSLHSQGPSPEEEIRDADLRELIVAFADLIPRSIETQAGLRQYWSSWTDDCTFVLRNRKFDPSTAKMSSLETYTISFSDILSAEQSEYLDLPSIVLRFFEGRGAELVRFTTDPNADDPIDKETRTALVVEFLVDDQSMAVAYANEIIRRCTKP